VTGHILNTFCPRNFNKAPDGLTVESTIGMSNRLVSFPNLSKSNGLKWALTVVSRCRPSSERCPGRASAYRGPHSIRVQAEILRLSLLGSFDRGRSMNVVF
jgi:hypothetical protein